MWIWLVVSSVSAVEPEVASSPPDTVRGVVETTAALERVRSVLADPGWVARVDGGKTKVDVRSKDGECLVADYVSPSALLEVTYQVRRCPTASGYEAKMLTSNAFKDYRVAWDLVSTASGGTQLQYTIQLTTSLWGVPNSLVLSTTKKSVRKMLERVVEALEVSEAP